MVKENPAVTPAAVNTAITQAASVNGYLCSVCNTARTKGVTIAGFPGPFNKMCSEWPRLAGFLRGERLDFGSYSQIRGTRATALQTNLVHALRPLPPFQSARPTMAGTRSAPR